MKLLILSVFALMIYVVYMLDSYFALKKYILKMEVDVAKAYERKQL